MIEDNAGLRQVLRQVLEEGGYEVREAAEGELGLQLFRAWTPEVVLTDIMMPGKDGLETMLALRQEAPQVKIIAMSGGGHLVTKHNVLCSATDFGALRTLAKPFSLDDLLGAVAAVLTAGDE